MRQFGRRIERATVSKGYAWSGLARPPRWQVQSHAGHMDRSFSQQIPHTRLIRCDTLWAVKHRMEPRQVREIVGRASLGVTAVVTLVFAVLASIARLSSGPASYKPGDRMEAVPGITFSEAPKTLLVAFTTSCPDCTVTMLAVKRLQHMAKPRSFRFVGITTDPELQAKKYVSDNGVELDSIVSVDASLLRIRVAPTVILVDKHSAVVSIWTGPLSVEQESEILAALEDN
jgi:hypothetical protein